MTPAQLGALWDLPLRNKAMLAKASEAMIERTYRLWLRDGDLAVDVGANVGRHLLPLADAVGPTGEVMGFEPIPDLAQPLQARLAKAGLDGRVTLRQLAIGEQPGASAFHYIRAAPAMSGLRRRQGLPEEPQEELLEVEVETLDRLLAGRAPRFVKIDVEGAEYPVMRGMAGLMRSARPLIAFEDGRGGSSRLYGYAMDQFYAFFEELDYVVLDLFGFRTTNAMSRYPGPWNFYAVPKEQQAAGRDAVAYAMMNELWGLLPA